MFVMILNWKVGENDPFSAFNEALASYLEASGKRSQTVELSDPGWWNRLLNAKLDGIDFVFTWQGLATNFKIGEKEQSFWEVLQVPLISMHGDHPCHMPVNHAFDSPYCAHLYAYPEYSLYAQRHFRKRSRTISVENPVFCLDERLDVKGGDHFVLPKNVTPPSVMEEEWKRQLSPEAFRFHMALAETLKAMLPTEDHLDFHAVIDELIELHPSEEYDFRTQADAYHHLHSRLDFYVRNVKAVSILDHLKDVPLQIIGRGWEPYARVASPHHEFRRAGNMADNQRQYYSAYGIIDVTPSVTGLHDRTYRAMRNQTPFLSSGYLPEFLPDMAPYDPLFYRFNGDDLREKCEAVMANPAAHAELAREFSYLHQMRIQPSHLMWQLDSLARSMDRS
ncbi:hypothetical protein [Geothrix sp. 21YS21S-4]|uniref:hypothetical protein n=1 Tax=Geothrix sp. 21YS21S-4 TaxID=3068889 RepID=UPI0027B8E1FB|nr:hypothetical protein [Geothrix sp. 21YS21S-4]